MRQPPVEEYRRIIMGHAREQGWSIYRDDATPSTAVLLIRLADQLQMLHVDVLPDGDDSNGEASAALVRAGIKARIVHAPSEVGRFLIDLGDISRSPVP